MINVKIVDARYLYRFKVLYIRLHEVRSAKVNRARIAHSGYME